MNKAFLIILTFVLSCSSLWAQSPVLSVEAPSPDPTLIVRGPEQEVVFVNCVRWAENDNALFLFTDAYGEKVAHERRNFTAIQVDAQMKVIGIVNGGVNKGDIPGFDQALSLTIPKGGFVLVASDDAYTTRGLKKFVAESFRTGDLAKLRVNGEITALKDVVKQFSGEAEAAISLDGDMLRTVTKPKILVEGFISNYSKKGKYTVDALLNGKTTPLRVNSKGQFRGWVDLSAKTNYITLSLQSAGKELQTAPLSIYYKDKSKGESEVVLWVEQFPNAKVLTTEAKVKEMILNAKKAGFTAVGFDVKGPEGFVSYRKNNLSKTPYLTELTNPNKQIEDTGIDLLEVMTRICHEQGLKVYASFNFFTEGNITAKDYAVLNENQDWEQIVQRPEDKGKLLRVRASQHGRDAAAGKKVALAFVNPSNKEVQDFQLLRVEEVLQNYPIDGIVLDRCRYDNLYADFSHVTRNAFAEFLHAEGKHLESFPNDAFVIDAEGALVKGQYYKEWILFRSLTIKQFTDRVRALIDKYKATLNPKLQMAAYVGSWYEVYYQNGVNWASKDFEYNESLNFPESEIYGALYSETSYVDNLDFLMIGTYYKTEKEINRYITLGNILTNGNLPLLGSMSLPDLKTEEQTEVFKASLENSSGLMIFDNCYIKWPEFISNMQKAVRGR